MQSVPITISEPLNGQITCFFSLLSNGQLIALCPVSFRPVLLKETGLLPLSKRLVFKLESQEGRIVHFYRRILFYTEHTNQTNKGGEEAITACEIYYILSYLRRALNNTAAKLKAISSCVL